MKSEKKTILVVDDHEEVVELVQAGLVPQGFRILKAVGAKAALHVSDVYYGQIDLLLTDVVMPFMNGKHLAGRICEDRPDIKVIFMSAYSRDVILSHGVVPEGVCMVQKPFRIQELVNTVEAILSKGPSWKQLVLSSQDLRE